MEGKEADIILYKQDKQTGIYFPFTLAHDSVLLCRKMLRVKFLC